MNLFDLIAVLITAAALFSWINHRFLKLPTTIGVMLIALALALALAVLDRVGIALVDEVTAVLAAIDFDEALLHGMLSFLLFAGALHVNLEDLRRHKWVVATLASFGVLISTALVGLSAWLLFQAMGLGIGLIWCLLFGALISPTDPIAVLATLKRVGAPKALEIKIAGESLFNDGVGVVVFIVLLGIATGQAETTAAAIAEIFLLEAVGGAVFGLALGLVGYQLLKSVDSYEVEVLLTLAMVTGGYALAYHLHLSAPIAIVVAGLMIGNQGRAFAMSDNTRERLDEFWELVDEILNAVLFLLIGIEVLVLTFDLQRLLAGVALVPVVLAIRFVSVGTPIALFRLRREFPPRTIRILTWGGLRGGISVALALSLPAGPIREQLLMATYVIVLFSLLVQGLTISRLLPPPAPPVTTGSGSD
ncbi:MAG TPA: sodium:proton antiporter [Xanthomonadaceae bacterium]|nr:sodium:proton antiporter [Xanthomonadaceae bacterium]